VVIQGTMDCCIDGSSFQQTAKATMTMDLRAAADVNGMTFAFTIAASGTIEESQDDVAPKKK